MSLSCITDYLAENFQFLSNELKNGECRFLALPAGDPATDDAGFPSDAPAARTAGFIPCAWTAKKFDEKEVATQTRATAGYEVVVAQQFEGAAVVCKQSDRLELKINLVTGETIECEIVARLNESNVFWRIFAVDIDDEN